MTVLKEMRYFQENELLTEEFFLELQKLSTSKLQLRVFSLKIYVVAKCKYVLIGKGHHTMS